MGASDVRAELPARPVVRLRPERADQLIGVETTPERQRGLLTALGFDVTGDWTVTRPDLARTGRDPRDRPRRGGRPLRARPGAVHAAGTPGALRTPLARATPAPRSGGDPARLRPLRGVHPEPRAGGGQPDRAQAAGAAHGRARGPADEPPAEPRPGRRSTTSTPVPSRWRCSRWPASTSRPGRAARRALARRGDSARAASSGRRASSRRSTTRCTPRPASSRAEQPFLHPGKAARVEAGWLGELHPALLPGWSAFELDLAALLEATPDTVTYEDVITFPGVRQDLAVVVAEEVPAGELVGAAQEAAGEELCGMRVFDVYRGEQVGAGRKSIAFVVVFQSSERTLTDDDAAALRSRIVEALAERFGAELRGGRESSYGSARRPGSSPLSMSENGGSPGRSVERAAADRSMACGVDPGSVSGRSTSCSKCWRQPGLSGDAGTLDLSVDIQELRLEKTPRPARPPSVRPCRSEAARSMSSRNRDGRWPRSWPSSVSGPPPLRMSSCSGRSSARLRAIARAARAPAWASEGGGDARKAMTRRS